MKNFYRALREAWSHWLPLSAGILCSFVMAMLWGANIVALFPAIETVVHGDNLQSWNEKRILAVREKVAALKMITKRRFCLPRQTAATTSSG